MRAGSGGMWPRGQRKFGAEDAAAGLEVRRRGHPGVCDHRIVAQHLSGSGQEPEEEMADRKKGKFLDCR